MLYIALSDALRLPSMDSLHQFTNGIGLEVQKNTGKGQLRRSKDGRVSGMDPFMVGVIIMVNWKRKIHMRLMEVH